MKVKTEQIIDAAFPFSERSLSELLVALRCSFQVTIFASRDPTKTKKGAENQM